MLCDGIHEAIIDMNLWEAAQEKRKAQAKKYEHVNKGKDEKIHLLSGLLRCPVCGSGMYGNKSIKNKNGILILAVITRTIIFLHTSRRERFHFRPFEIGSEREEFFVPGDPQGSDEDID